MLPLRSRTPLLARLNKVHVYQKCQYYSTTTTTTTTTAHSNPLKVAVIGSGPSGFYSMESILTNHQDSYVTIFEKLPTPFGLVRFGVAPDHPEVKLVKNKFEKLMVDHPHRCSFVGNISIGHSISIDDLKKHFDAIILAYGAEGERKLGIDGENLNRVYSARDFVAWLNGHPNYRSASFDLSSETVTIIGQGNVAIDVARMLLRDIDELSKTDISSHAVDLLRVSKVKNVHLIGRRGISQAAFTTSELRELIKLNGVESYLVDEKSVELNSESAQELQDDRVKRRKVELLKTLKVISLDNNTSTSNKKLYFHFLRLPSQIYPESPSSKDVGGVLLEKCKLEGVTGDQKATGTGEFERLDCGIVFRSIGYKGVSMPGVPFDQHAGVVPNEKGKVVGDPQLYVSGWLKRGPTGIIGTNKWDAEETVQSLLDDLKQGKLNKNNHNHHQIGLNGVPQIKEILEQRGLKTVSFDQWKKIEKEEVERGKQKGKVLEKFTVVEDMMELLNKDS